MTETKSSAKMTDITEKREIFADPAIRKQLKITTISRDTPVYIEIYRRIQRLIRQNLLQFGDQLPGEHELAAIMGVGRTSLRTALSILYEDGYIRTRKGKGSFVCYDSRREKHRRKAPLGFLFPPERIALQGELSKSGSILTSVGCDDFLTEKFRPQPSHEIMLFARVYRLNGLDAIYSTWYFLSGLTEEDPADDDDARERKIIDGITANAVVAEYECVSVPVEAVKAMDLPCEFEGSHHTLVTTTYVDGENRVTGFCKDYYNDAVIRFAISAKK